MELKTVIVGDTDVGKTSLSARFTHGEMPPASTPTIGASFLQKRLHVDPPSAAAPTGDAEGGGTGSSRGEQGSSGEGGEPVEIVFQLWDTAGQERFRSMAPMYYRGAKAAVIVFDISKEGGFDRVENFRRDILQFGDPNVVIAVVANKADLPHHPTFDLGMCEDASTSIGASFHVASAVSGEGIDDLFAGVARSAVRAHSRQWNGISSRNLGPGDDKGGGDSPVVLSSKGEKKKRKPCC